PRTYSGSASCKECHEKFYTLWETSHHGNALQPWSAKLAAALPPQPEPIQVEGNLYQAFITPESGWVMENGTNRFPIAYALGGKNYYNFLTLLDDGRLQVLPVFYDVRNKSWGNTTQSMLRHFDDGRIDSALPWRDSMLTFNAACFSCHVSQIDSNYDPETDTYATTWNEPGISCESCHGPASEHIRVCKAAPTNAPPKDLQIIGWWEMRGEQRDSACAGCHTKGAPISPSYETGDRYWDHFDLTTFEHADYYPDGRDLGENYTMGSWWLSPCVNQSQLDCIHCHTSSGRDKHKANPNNACISCHQERVEKIREHSHHEKLTCVSCHMPMTPFGGMNQSDHSMRPPMPNLSIAVGSRNACVMCHTNQSNQWALDKINNWHPDFEKRTAPELERALLVQALRQGDMEQLSAALAYIADPASDPLFVTTLIRLLPPSNESRQHTVLRERLANANHPLVRSAAATALDADNLPADRPALLAALSDDYRIVRIRAAERLVALPDTEIPNEYRKAFDAAVDEMWESVNIRMDHWSSSYNAGNILMRQNKIQEASEKYDRAHKLRNDIPQPLINGSMAFAQLGRLDEAELRLKKATTLPEPSAEAHFNLGLLYGEQNRTNEARAALYKSLEINPQNHRAACNLAILLAGKNYPETFRLLHQAIQLDPYNPRYVQTLAYYYINTRQADLAKRTLEQAFQRGLVTPELQGMYQQLR
ncbi:MAG: ammonia-forming cytochrome c nitrite reductase subunit c552, partial [Kiritimatiellaceae bacterium]|nr:ammonia-forming cytochrome c nitrite reductase subunit c552 [Kiritimatiellaceae bacterium]